MSSLSPRHKMQHQQIFTYQIHQPLNLCAICEENYPQRIPLLCGFFHFFVHPSGPRLAAPRWVKASYRWSGYDFRLGGEEFGSGRGWNLPAKPGYMWVWAWTQSILCSTSLSTASGVEKQLLVLVGLWSFVFAQRTALQPRDPYFVSKKEDRRCLNRLAPDAWEKIETMPCWGKK